MRVLVVYDSKTGNTRKVAESIAEEFGKRADLMSFDELTKELKPAHYEYILVGFWLDKGTCRKRVEDFLKSLANCKVGLFMTLGADPRSTYAEDSLEKVAGFLPESSFYIGGFSCRGRIDPDLTLILEKKYEETGDEAIAERLYSHKEAFDHPTEEDLANAQDFFNKNVVFD